MGWFKKLTEGAKHLVSDPVGWASNIGEQSYNGVSQMPGRIVGGVTGSEKLENAISPPTWDEWSQPGEAFYGRVNDINKYVPTEQGRQYAPAIEGAVLSVFNPFAGAAFTTAYNAGAQQANPDQKFSWGDLGKDAAVNFGTAVVANWAKNAASAKTAADASKSTTALSSMGATPNTSNLLTAGAPQSTAFNVLQDVPSAMSQFSMPAASASLTPVAMDIQSSGAGTALKSPNTLSKAGDAAYATGVKAAPQLANQALTATLQPELNQPISGAGIAEDLTVDSANTNFGNLLSAFGGNELTTPNASGPRIDQNAYNAAMDRISANQYLQYQEKGDQYIPAGQVTPDVNTPYGGSLGNIDKSTEAARTQYADQAANYNRYWAIRDQNPTMTDEQMQTYLDYANNGVALPSNYAVPNETLMGMFKGTQPLIPNI